MIVIGVDVPRADAKHLRCLKRQLARTVYTTLKAESALT
jgi:hypothetical protein